MKRYQRNSIFPVIERTRAKWGVQKQGSNVHTNSRLPRENHSAHGLISSSLPNHFLSLHIAIADKDGTWTLARHVNIEYFEVWMEDPVIDFAPLHAKHLPLLVSWMPA